MRLILILTALWFVLLLTLNVQTASARTGWQSATASFYMLYGNRTACGLTMSPRSWHVASLKSDTARCGMRVSICRQHRPNRKVCIKAKVMDRGSWRSDDRRWDLTPRIYYRLKCDRVGTPCPVTWQHGW